jgi:hypothetical protein
MGPADTIRVKISSEAAEAVALTPVVARDMPILELIENIAAVSLEPARVQDLLKRGSLVSGASRFRWQPLDLPVDQTAALLDLLPKSDPLRPFNSANCVRIALVAGLRRWNLTPEAASRRGLIHSLLLRPSFWTRLLAACPAPAYRSYLYKERADLYFLDLDDSSLSALRAALAALPYPSLRAELSAARLTSVEWLLRR